MSLYKALALKSIGVEVWMEAYDGEYRLFDENTFLLDNRWTGIFVGVEDDAES